MTVGTLLPAYLDNLAAAGTGTSIGHHGEIVQGVFEDGRQLLHGLVTLPMPSLLSEATFRPAPVATVTVEPPVCLKAKRGAELALQHFGAERGGHLSIRSAIPVGLGLGSSTADVVAAIRAVAAALGQMLANHEQARLAVRAETASDSVMLGMEAVLFAQREGVIIEPFGGVLPPMNVVSVDPAPGTWVSTLDLPLARYLPSEVTRFAELRALVRQGVARGDLRAVGEAATASAEINQRHLACPRFGELVRVAERTGARGVQVAHSGAVVGLMYDRTDRETESMLRGAAAARALGGVAVHCLAGAGEPA